MFAFPFPTASQRENSAAPAIRETKDSHDAGTAVAASGRPQWRRAPDLKAMRVRLSLAIAGNEPSALSRLTLL